MIVPTKVNGYDIYPFHSKSQVLDYLSNGNFNKILVSLNAEILLKKDERLRYLVNNNIGFADGVGAVMALNKKGYTNALKIPGCELWIEIIRKFHSSKSFFFVGGTSEVINQTVNKLKKEFPAINIVGHRDGYIKNIQDRRYLLNDIRIKKPDVVFVAMGAPLQEYLMQEMQSYNKKALYMGLGGSFDVYIGKVKRAPIFWINLNLEWAYRLLKQPRRIIRQLVLVEFFLKLNMNKL